MIESEHQVNVICANAICRSVIYQSHNESDDSNDGVEGENVINAHQVGSHPDANQEHHNSDPSNQVIQEQDCQRGIVHRGPGLRGSIAGVIRGLGEHIRDCCDKAEMN